MANQIVVSAGAKVRNLSGVLTATSGVVSFLPIDVSLGIPQLDVNGKILVSQLPNSVMEYKGTWSAATNTPTLANGTGNQGDVYLCNVAGTVDFGAGPIAFFVGDQVIYSGSIWQRASGATGTVTSVAVTESGDSLNITGSPITTSGTINIGFNGTNLQYVNGAGNLTTFPILTGYVTAVSGTAPVVSSGGTTPAISMAAATGSVDGYLLATDFAIFSAKQSALTFSSPLINTSGTISIPAATTSVNGYLASADFTTFNNKQNTITLTTTGTSGASTLVGATLNIPNYGSALTGYVTLATTQTITGAKTFSGYTTFTSTVDITSGLTFSNSGFTLLLQPPTLSVNRTVTLPNGTGTLALTSDIPSLTGYVPYTGATTDVDLGNFSITGNVSTFRNGFINGNSSVQGQLMIKQATLGSTNYAGYSSIYSTGTNFTIISDVNGTDYKSAILSFGSLTNNTTRTFTFPNATGTIALTSDLTGYLTAVTATSPLSSSGGTTPNITIAQATTSANGYLSSTDWNTFNGKQNAITLTTTGTSGAATLVGATLNIPQYADQFVGTVTSVAALTIGTTGTDLSSSVANSTTTPVITLNVPTASATNRGALSSADWTTFNNKQSALTNPVTGTGTTNYLPKFTGTSTIGNSILQESGNAIGLGLTPNAWLSAAKALQLSDGSIWGLTTLDTYVSIGGNYYYSGNFVYIKSAKATDYYQYDGQHVWRNAPSGTAGNLISFTQKMILDASGNLTVGSTAGTGTGALYAGAATFSSTVTATAFIPSGATVPTNGMYLSAANTLNFATASTNRLTINSSGNLGLDVTPSAWNSDYVALQFGAKGLLYGRSGGEVAFGTNWYRSSGGSFLYATNGFASYQAQADGVHYWFQAPSGTAGAAITFTQAMTLDASGNFMIGNTTNNGAKVVFKGANGVPASSGTTTTAVFRVSSGTGLYNVLDFGTNEASDYSWIQSTRANSLGTYDYLAIQPNGGNLLVGTLVNSTYKLDVNGTGRFTGTIVSLNQNALTSSTISNTTAGTGSYVETTYISNSGAGIGALGKYSSSTNAYKITTPSSTYLYNGTAGNIAIQNDFSGGSIVMAAGGSSTAHFTIASTGAATFSSSVTAGNLISSAGIGFAGVDIKSDRTTGNLGGFRAYRGIESFSRSEMLMKADGAITFNTGDGTTNVTERVAIAAGGAATFSSSVSATSFFESSDSRLKTLIQDNHQTKGIASITPKLYTKNGKVELGYYAQDFVGILDSAVSKGSDDMLSLSYREVLVAKVYALEQRIKELETK